MYYINNISHTDVITTDVITVNNYRDLTAPMQPVRQLEKGVSITS